MISCVSLIPGLHYNEDVSDDNVSNDASESKSEKRGDILCDGVMVFGGEVKRLPSEKSSAIAELLKKAHGILLHSYLLIFLLFFLFFF